MDDEAMRADIQEYMAMALSSVDLAKSYAVIIAEANRQLEFLMESIQKMETYGKKRGKDND